MLKACANCSCWASPLSDTLHLDRPSLGQTNKKDLLFLIDRAPLSLRLPRYISSARSTMPSIHQTNSSDGYDAKDLEVAKGAYETTSSSPSSVRLGESDGGVFATGGNIDAYKPIDEYEGAHRYDPHFEWTEKEETSLVRRVCTIQAFSSALDGDEQALLASARLLVPKQAIFKILLG